MQCNLCNITRTHEHFARIYKYTHDMQIEPSYYATVIPGIEEAYAVVAVELSQVYIPVYAATQQGDNPRNYIWIEIPEKKPLTPSEFEEAIAKQRLEYLRNEIHMERIDTLELAELQSLAQYIEPGDVELLQWAGVPEFPEEENQ